MIEDRALQGPDLHTAPTLAAAFAHAVAELGAGPAHPDGTAWPGSLAADHVTQLAGLGSAPVAWFWRPGAQCVTCVLGPLLAPTSVDTSPQDALAVINAANNDGRIAYATLADDELAVTVAASSLVAVPAALTADLLDELLASCAEHADRLMALWPQLGPRTIDNAGSGADDEDDELGAAAHAPSAADRPLAGGDVTSRASDAVARHTHSDEMSERLRRSGARALAVALVSLQRATRLLLRYERWALATSWRNRDAKNLQGHLAFVGGALLALIPPAALYLAITLVMTR